MAEINVERKKSIWPWIIAAIIVVLLIWAVLAMMGRDTADTAVVVAPVATDPVLTAPGAPEATPDLAPATTPITADMPDDTTAAEQRDAALDRYAGTFVSGNIQLVLSSAGTYTMRESPAGEARGRWSYDESANALHLDPADGSQDRYFRVEGIDTLTPLNPEGDPAAQMAPLQRVGDQ